MRHDDDTQNSATNSRPIFPLQRPYELALRMAFDVLPRVPIIIIRYEEDEDLGAGANVIYHADAAHLLPAEDRIVAAELVIDVLNGKQLAENGGVHAQRR